MSMVPRERGPSPKHIPHRDRAYREYVASQPCMACGYHETQAAHISVGNFARGMKADDFYCIPLCPSRVGVLGCHFIFDLNQKHYAKEWFKKTPEELKEEAKAFWQQWLSEAA